MDNFTPGTIVEITGRVIKITGKTTSVFATKLSRPVKAMVLGKSRLYTGTITGGYRAYDEYEPAYLTNIKSHPVWMVMLLSGTRYRKPIAVLEEQIQAQQEAVPA